MSYGRVKRPEGVVRRSQLLTRAGPGAPVDLVRDAVVIAGLESWQYASDAEGFFSEPRLQQSAHRLLLGTGQWSHGLPRLRRPPECDENDPSPRVGIAAVEFPGWFLCQNARCRSLVHWRGLNDRRRHTCSHDSSDDYPVVPIRFVQACARGHLAEVHWRAFVHRGVREEGMDGEEHAAYAFCRRQPGSGLENDPLGDSWSADLYLFPVGTTGDIADYLVGCRKCGARRGLQDLAVQGLLGTCAGWRPWLGPHANEPCTEQARLLIRTATNAYFPQNVSVLSIPDASLDLRRKVDEHLAVLRKVETAAQLHQLRGLVDAIATAFADFEDGEILEEIRRRRLNLPVAAPPVREAEWEALMRASFEIPGELPPRGEDWFARRVEGLDLPTFLDRVVLVHTLKEVRAQVGFTRLEGFGSDAEGEYALDGQRSAPLSLSVDWIPAVEIRGEGVLLAFSEDALRAWEDRPAVKAIDERFRRALKAANEARGQSAIYPGIRLVLLHSLAHLLITAISLECGYPASSIRERLYCHRADGDDADAKKRSRAGILLYTGTPGSEGTLGGLVEVGRDIVRHLRRAAESALLCSNDPICAQHDPAGMEEGREREGAACHACLLIAEPSCERMNRDLDRTLVVPTVENAAAAFLGDWLATG